MTTDAEIPFPGFLDRAVPTRWGGGLRAISKKVRFLFSLPHSRLMEPPIKVGIICTLRGPEYTLESWIVWHLHVGIRFFYLFFDDPEDASIEIAMRYQSHATIRVYRPLTDVEHFYRPLASFETFHHIYETEVPVRQQLNAEYAIERAVSDAVDWVLHLDSDELFYVFPPCTLQTHFSSLKGLDSFTYLNFEGVPDSERIGDYFSCVTLFRRHISSIEFNQVTSRAVLFWTSRTTRGQYMISYDNGKSSARVRRGLRPSGVHGWKSTRSRDRSKTSILDAKSLDMSRFRFDDRAVVLHYVVCGLYWYIKKYRTLDAFPNAWYGGKLLIPPCFHLDSRDAFLNGDYEAMRRLYVSQVMLDKAEVIEEQLKASVCCRIIGVREGIAEEYQRLWKEVYRPVLVSEMTGPHSMDRGGKVERSADGRESKVNTLSMEKNWIISSLVLKFVLNVEEGSQASYRPRN
ncbi:uncharacterized protein LOC126324032 [Schistocerca gregaria]|uniref:uncharacterized protein LOC126324032 n=1 Tax=Schistocerca gregaria TaxID=7010 RepID=UPI00211F3068|nr:uncharacterized protein LOC126324032 [Schistocerca gregaria]